MSISRILWSKLAAIGLAGLAFAACAPTPTAILPPPVPAIPSPTTAPSATVAPTPVPPTSTPAPTATATPRPAARFDQMTLGGCCVQAFFSPDSARILFLDRPTRDGETGIWGVPTDKPLAAPALAFRQLGPFSADMSMAIDLVGGNTVVERIADGAKWTIPNGGRRVSFSPDAKRIAWTVSQDFGNFDVRRSDIYVAAFDGTNPKLVATRYGGGVQAWMPDSARLLIAGKTNPADAKTKLSVLALSDGKILDVLETERSRGVSVSPDGQWGIHLVAQAQTPTDNGVFLLRLDGGAAPPVRLNFFGAFKWCDSRRLLFVPLDLNAPSNELWRLDVQTLKSERLIAAAENGTFKIASGDWDIAPDGRHVTYLNARDRNIWTVSLPVACGLEP